MLRVTEVNEINQLFELRDEWNDALERSRDNHIYLTWEWQSTYWKHFGKERKLRILYITDGSKIIAIAPLRQSHYSFANLFGYNVIEPLGCWGSAGYGADYNGFILGEREAECLKLLLNYLVEHDDWDFIYLYDTPGTSPIPKLLPKISEDIPSFEIEEGEICPYISIPNSLEIFKKRLSSRFRKHLRRCLRKLKKDYQKVELKRYDELGSVEETMTIYFELHQKRWRTIGMPGVFNTPKIRDFSLDVAKRLASNGWLALYFLTVNDEPVAAQHCLEHKQKMYYGLGGFDPDYSRYSPGNLIIEKVIEKCIQKRIREYDFLKGGEPYKFTWTAKYRRNFDIRLSNKRPTSDLYQWGIRAAKQMKLERILGRFLDF